MKSINFKGIMMMFLMVCFVVQLSSCKNKDDNASNNPIVGSWTCTDHYYGGSDTFTFKSNGTYTWTYKAIKDWSFDDHSGNYAFDQSRSTLTIHSNKGTTWVYIIISLTSKSFTLMDEDGDTYYYQKN